MNMHTSSASQTVTARAVARFYTFSRPLIGRGLRRRHLIVSFLLLLTLAASVRADCDDCEDKEKVKITFKVKACSGVDFAGTLAGVTVTGTGGDCANPFYTNEGTAQLEIDETYTMTVSGGTCGSYVNFIAPKGYKIYINGHDAKTIKKNRLGEQISALAPFSDPAPVGASRGSSHMLAAAFVASDSGVLQSLYGAYRYVSELFLNVPSANLTMMKDKECEASSPGDGDGTWQIVVRKDCDECNGDDLGASSCPVKVNSVHWSVPLGKLSDGRSAQKISIREETMSSAIYTPAALTYSPPGLTSEVDVVRNQDQSLRQVKVPQGLADVVVLSGSEYEVRFYNAAAVGAKVNNVYTVTGQPFITWNIKNPNPATNDRLQITNIENGRTVTVEYVWNAANNSWTLNEGGGERIETVTETIDQPTGDRIKTAIIKDNASQVISKTARTYHNFAWGEDLIRVVADPDVAALTTSYTYYQNAAEDWRYGKLESVTNPDGSWEKYDYDNLGNTALIMKPWKNLTLAAATEANSDATRYYFTNTDGITEYGFARIVTMTEEKVEGTLVRRTNFYRTRDDSFGFPAVREEQRVAFNAATAQSTFTTTFHSSAPDYLAGRVVAVEHPDGGRDTYNYEKGNYTVNADPTLSQFTPDANGRAQRVTVTHGTTTVPDGIALKTTRDISINDESGHVVFQETQVYTGGTTYVRVGWIASTYNSRGQLTQRMRHNGIYSTTVWDGDRVISVIDESGVETAFSNFDALGRARTVTNKGIAAGGGFPAQADIVTTSTFDPEGRTLSESMTAGSLTLTGSSTYDVAGRLKTQTNHAGLVTSYSYTNGGRTQTVTLPGGATRITDRYLDGRTKSITGTSEVARYFDYGVNTADGTQFTQEFAGNSGLSSPRWTKTTTDWLGRAIMVEKPTFTSGTTLVQSLTYNEKGQLKEESVAVGTSKLLADKVYEYDSLGDQVASGFDLNDDNVLTPSSTDRLTETGIVYEQSGADWFRVSTTKTYLKDNDPTATAQTQKERLNNFPVNGTDQTISETLALDVAGNQSKVTTLLDRAARKVTQKTDMPDSATDGVSITVNGLLQSSSPTAPRSATSYTYDALRRRTSVADPSLGTVGTAYSATTGQVVSESHGTDTTTYAYYPSTHASAGKLMSQTDPASKKVYFNYSSRGEMTQTWGDTAYPIEYVYDEYGQQTDLRTFRGGTGWTASSWPTSTTGTADVTRWIYNAATGLLAQKQDSATKQIVYTYDSLGRVKTRQLARLDATGNPITTTYSYESRTGEVSVVDYSDATPDVTFVYDRGGRKSYLTDAAGTHTLTYNAVSDLKTDQVASGILDGVKVDVGYDTFLRRNSLQATRSTTTLSSQTYIYDTHSRLDKVTSGAQTATYTYFPTTGLLQSTGFTGGTNLTRSYDTLGRIQTISTIPSGGGTSSYTYTYNNLGQRTKVTREDGSYWSYTYNDRGELLTGKKYWSDSVPAAGQQMEYVFDNIGNRTTAKAGGDAAGAGLRLSTYTPNGLNQYTQRTVPGAFDVIGTALPGATVTVNNQATYRKADYFQKALTVDNAAVPVYATVNVVGAKGGVGAGGEDAVTLQSGYVYVPKAVETYAFDADGNTLTDGQWNYMWDAENRLVRMDTIASAPAGARQRLEFAYDYLGRRISKKVYGWNATVSAFYLQSTTKFVYDGWNLLAELSGNNTLVRNYIRGIDLLSVNGGGSVYYVGQDGNQNVVALVKSDGTLAATYDYDPFGQTLRATGAYASQNPFRFSGQYTDAETGFVYYGYRYYNPQTGRWISRDPSEETGGMNLYGFVGNDPVNEVDYLGLWKKNGQWSGGWKKYQGMVTADDCNDLKKLAKLITGNPEDWRVLGIPDDVKENQVVNIAPLLVKFEERLRESVVAATSKFNAKEFGPIQIDVVGETELIGPGNVTPEKNPTEQEDTLNKFFGSNPYGSADCDSASSLVLQKGLLDVLSRGEYDKLDQGTLFIDKKGYIREMIKGDRGGFPNYSDYLQKGPDGIVRFGAWQQENVIKIGEDRYWGYIGSNAVSPQQQWENLLRQKFNEEHGQRRRRRIPGFYRPINITFLNVAKIGSQLFDIRNK